MDSGLLHKYTDRVANIADASAAEADSIDDLGAFGWLRGARDRCPMLELRKRSGNILAIGYGWMERIEFDPSMGVLLWVPGHVVRITGRNLNAELRPNVRLFEGIARHRVPWLREVDRTVAIEAPDNACIIDLIEW